MATKIQFRRDTSANWTATNPILAQGEIGIELVTFRQKIGDGATAWNSLGYSLTVPLSKYDATVDPAVTDDVTDGYGVGSVWVNVTGDKGFVCVDATTNTAVWIEITQQNTDTQRTYETSTANIKMNGTVSVGASANVPRADHVHASDTTRLALAGGTMSGELNCADNLLTRPVIKDYGETVAVNATATGSVTVNLVNGNVHRLTLTGNITTLTLSNPPASGTGGSLTLVLVQGSTARSIAWPNSVKWTGGTAPGMVANKTYIVTMFTTDAGTIWYAMKGGEFT